MKNVCINIVLYPTATRVANQRYSKLHFKMQMSTYLSLMCIYAVRKRRTAMHFRVSALPRESVALHNARGCKLSVQKNTEIRAMLLRCLDLPQK